MKATMAKCPGTNGCGPALREVSVPDFDRGAPAQGWDWPRGPCTRGFAAHDGCAAVEEDAMMKLLAALVMAFALASVASAVLAVLTADQLSPARPPAARLVR